MQFVGQCFTSASLFCKPFFRARCGEREGIDTSFKIWNVVLRYDYTYFDGVGGGA